MDMLPLLSQTEYNYRFPSEASITFIELENQLMCQQNQFITWDSIIDVLLLINFQSAKSVSQNVNHPKLSVNTSQVNQEVPNVLQNLKSTRTEKVQKMDFKQFDSEVKKAKDEGRHSIMANNKLNQFKTGQNLNIDSNPTSSIFYSANQEKSREEP